VVQATQANISLLKLQEFSLLKLQEFEFRIAAAARAQQDSVLLYTEMNGACLALAVQLSGFCNRGVFTDAGKRRSHCKSFSTSHLFTRIMPSLQRVWS
jgi:hypothetical protein